MHNSLNGLPKRVLIDTNVLLDAAFVNGAARKSIGLLHDLGFPPVVDEMIELEAKRILNGYRKSIRPQIDLEKGFSDYISFARILRLPPAPPISSTVVNRADRHVLSAAVHYRAWVLTGDCELNVQLRAADIQARLPFDVIMEAATADGANPPLETLFRVISPTSESGMIFGRVSGGNWMGLQSVGKYTVCDVENVGRTYYDTGTENWVFEMPIGVSARIKCPLQKGEQWAVCGSYRLRVAGKGGSVVIRAGKYPSTVCQASVRTLKTIKALSAGTIKFGRSMNDDEFLNGSLSAVVIGPQGMGNDTWRAITAIPEGAPNPYDSGVLERVLKHVSVLNPQPRLLRIPTEEDLRKLRL